MSQVTAFSALALTIGLTLRPPAVLRGARVAPVLAAGIGVGLVLAAGNIGATDFRDAAETLWRPFAALAAIMVITDVAARFEVVERLAALAVPRAEGSAARLFAFVFAISLGTAAVLNNDAAILLLTPAVVVLVRKLYPDRPALVVAFAYAVFAAAGVAPFITSNPMNTVVAHAAGIDFNEYALRMVPVAIIGSLTTFAALRLVFAKELAGAPPPRPTEAAARWTRPQLQMLTVVIAVLAAYPVLLLVGVEVFAVALAGAVAALALARHHRVGGPTAVVGSAVAWEILVFLFGLFLLARALQNVGAVAWLSDLYEEGGTAVIGVTSAIGSALVNNHSMALTNLLAIDALPGRGREQFLAALVGGDLGPRLLPVGSLAGLLWLGLLRRLGVEISLRRFVAVGAALTVPSLAVSLLVLALIDG